MPRPSAEIDWLIELVGEVRAMRDRAQRAVEREARACIVIGGDRPTRSTALASNAATLARMAKLGSGDRRRCSPPQGSAQIVVGGVDLSPSRSAGAIDLDAETARLSKALEAAEKDRDGLAARLANPAFTERAKPEAVEKARADHDERAAEAERLRGGAGAAGLGSLARRGRRVDRVGRPR